MTPAQRWTCLLLHLIGRNLQRQQPLTAQSSVCLTLVTRRTAPSFATRHRVARRLLTWLTLFTTRDWSCF